MKKATILKHGSLICLFVFLFVSGIFAQTNFSGSWVFNESKSKLGEGPVGPMGSTAMVITQDDRILSVDQTMQGRDGEEMKMTSKYNLDGTESINTFMMDMKRKSTLTWSADRKSISIASSMVFERDGGSREMKESEKWKLSDDGKTLFIEAERPGRPDDQGNKVLKITMAFDKR